MRTSFRAKPAARARQPGSARPLGGGITTRRAHATTSTDREIFDAESNLERKRPFAMRALMNA